MQIHTQRKIAILFTLFILSACSSTEKKQDPENFEPKQLQRSYLYGKNETTLENTGASKEVSIPQKEEFRMLKSMTPKTQKVTNREVDVFFRKDTQKVKFAANNMPTEEFIHYVFGEILKTNYVVAPDIKGDPQQLTLNINKELSKTEAFKMISELFARNNITIDFESNTFFFQKSALSKAKAVIGIGNTISSIPQTSGQILQIIPLKYGIKLSVERTLRKMIEGELTPDVEQSSIFILSNRLNIVRAIELINLLDVPANRSKHIGLLSLNYISTEEYLMQMSNVLQSDGIEVGVGYQQLKNVLLVPLPHIGAIAAFAPDEDLLNRVRYWSSIIDQPSRGDNEQYFVYTPRYARASDMGDSVGQLLTLGRPANRRNRAGTGTNASQIQSQEQSNNQQTSFSAENVSFVVDERTNALIFNTTGNVYNRLLPLLDRLDVLPKQILLEVMIAEVTLTDEFQYGVEWALRNNSEISGGGSFGSFTDAIGSTNFTWVDQSTSRITASYFTQNRFVDVLSNPTILVRDGVAASINVGTQIPIEAGTIVNQGVTTANVEYRDTGVEVSVTPTVNAQDVVIMSIRLNISNTVQETAGSTTPSIFQRALNTEAVVTTGQTVILGGLISENNSDADTKVPVLGDLPVIGEVFSGKNNILSKTELVMLVTPRVLESNEEWQKLLTDFQNQMENIRFVQ